MIKSNDMLITSKTGATVHVNHVFSDSATIAIHNQNLGITDLKELRKFLKKLQRQLEQEDLDTLD